MENKISSRNYTLDIIRVVALCLVVLTHSSAPIVLEGESIPFIGNVLNSLSRPGVPLFVMISGALLLNENKQKNTTDMLKSAKNLLILTIAWGIIYSIILHIITPLIQRQPIPIGECIAGCIFGAYHMWYLYMLIGIYLATPFLRCFVKKDNHKLVLLYIIMALVSVFFTPVIRMLSSYHSLFQHISTLIDKFYLQFFAGYITYYLTGWYVVHVGFHNPTVKKALYALSVLSFGIIVASAHVTGDSVNAYSNTNIFVYLLSLGLFVALNELIVRTDTMPKKLLWLSNLSFGAYIVHAAVDFAMGFLLDGVANAGAHISLRFVSVLFISYLIACILSKIPVVKKLLRF